MSGAVQTYHMQNFMLSVTVILMRTPRNGEYRVSTGHLLESGESCSSRIRLYSIEFLVRVSHGNLQTIYVACKIKGCSLKTDSQPPLPIITPMHTH